MKKFIVKKIPDEQVYYDLDDLVEIDDERIIIYGNPNFTSFGKSILLSIVNGDYCDYEVEYDYETLEMLEKVTGKKWNKTTIKGYSQGDWQDVYYVEGEVSKEYIKEIEDFYMGKVTGFTVSEDNGDYDEFVPNDIVWEGKEAICKYLGLPLESTTIYEDVGYEKVYKYKEIN